MTRRYIVVLDIQDDDPVPYNLRYMAEQIGAALDKTRPYWKADAAVYWTLEDALTDRDQGIAADQQVNGT
jgi:uncharacterized protein (UPF0147 family)